MRHPEIFGSEISLSRLVWITHCRVVFDFQALAQVVESWKKKEAEKQQLIDKLQTENENMKEKEKQQQQVGCGSLVSRF